MRAGGLPYDPICRDFRLQPGQGFAWSYEDRRGPAPRIASGQPLVFLINSNRGHRPQIGALKVKRIRVIASALMAVFAAMAFAGGRASAEITDEYTEFQHCPFEDSKTQGTFRQQFKELLNKFLLGLNCYFGSITKTVRGSLQIRSTNQTDLELSHHNPITNEAGEIGSHRIGIELATRRTNALTSLTLSTA